MENDLFDLAPNRVFQNTLRCMPIKNTVAQVLPLEQLHFRGSKRLGDKGAQSIARCARLSGLKALSLKYCRVKRKGALALSNSPHLCAEIREQWAKKAAKLKA